LDFGYSSPPVLTSPEESPRAEMIGEYDLSSNARAFEDLSEFVLQQGCLNSGLKRNIARFM
jgi:hypothetical protein